MSGFENGAIQSIRNNQQLRRGPGEKFKESIYARRFLPVSSSTEKESPRMKRAEEQRKAFINKQLFWLGVAGILVYVFIKRLVM